MLFHRSLLALVLLLLPFALAVRVSVTVDTSSARRHHSPSYRSSPVDTRYVFSPEELRPTEVAHSMDAVSADTMSSGSADDVEIPLPELLEIAKPHNSVSDCWVVLNGMLLNITQFEHPFKDGLSHISRACGFDITRTLHAKHRDEYDEQMKAFKVTKDGAFLSDQTKNALSILGGQARDEFMKDMAAKKAKDRAELRARIAKMSSVELQSWLMTLNKKLGPKRK